MDKNKSYIAFSRHCVLCGDVSHSTLDLCLPCQRELQSQAIVCRRCALPVGSAVDTAAPLCGSCLQQAPPYTFVYRFTDYAPPMDRLIQHLKFNKQLHIARLLGELMAHDIHARSLPLPDGIVPVPLHPQRLKQRGFNQTVEIARAVSRMLGIKLDLHSCRRIRSTPEQSGLPAGQRKINMKGAFAVQDTIAGKHVAILDDVMTTGSTVNELASSLVGQGARRVDVWVCARANLPA